MRYLGRSATDARGGKGDLGNERVDDHDLGRVRTDLSMLWSGHGGLEIVEGWGSDDMAVAAGAETRV